VVVDVGKQPHYELAIHTIGNTAVAGDGVTKVLDLEGPLQPGRKKATEGGDERGEGGQEEGVDLHRRHRDAELVVGRQKQQIWCGVRLGQEDGVGVAIKAVEDIGAKVRRRADEVLGPQKDVGQEHGEDGGHDPGTHEALDCLLRRDLDELGTSEGDTANIGENIVGDDQRRGHKEPDHALKQIVHDEVGLDNDQEQRDVRPPKVCELELV